MTSAFPHSSVPQDPIRNREPATGKSLPALSIATGEEVLKAVRDAREAQQAWAAIGFRERKRKLLAFQRLLADRAEEVSAAIHRETGKPRFEALVHEVFPVVYFTGFFARRAKRILSEKRNPLRLFGPLKVSRIRHEPRGVIGIISPWNYPFFLPVADAVMALAAGNAVVVKPSEWTPKILLLAKGLLEEAGIDPRLFGVVVGRGETGQALIEAGVDMVVFTGSVATGKKVGAACGERLIPYVAELGGKDAAIVLPDADVKAAARQIVWGAFANSGQVCASVERVLVHHSIRDAFVAEVVSQTRNLRQGDDGEGEVDVGPMVMRAQVGVVEKQLAEAVAGGARVLAGGKAFGEEGARYFEPTVVVDVGEEMSIWKEETFGPCLPIRSFEDPEEAIREANRSSYGLSAYLFSGNVREARRLAKRLDAGTVMINDVLYTGALPQAPWGGVKNSGVGRVHGEQGLRDLCEVRHVSYPRIPAQPLWMFPYRRTTHRWIERAVRTLSRL